MTDTSPGDKPSPLAEGRWLWRRLYVFATTGGAWLLLDRLIGIALVAADRAHVVDVLDAAERLVATRPEFDLLSTRRGLAKSTDED